MAPVGGKLLTATATIGHPVEDFDAPEFCFWSLEFSTRPGLVIMPKSFAIYLRILKSTRDESENLLLDHGFAMDITGANLAVVAIISTIVKAAGAAISHLLETDNGMHCCKVLGILHLWIRQNSLPNLPGSDLTVCNNRSSTLYTATGFLNA